MSDFTIAAVCHFSLIIPFTINLITAYLYPLQKIKNGFSFLLRKATFSLLLFLPLIIWLIYGNHVFIADQAKQACNFELNFLLIITAISFLFPLIVLKIVDQKNAHDRAYSMSSANSFLKAIFILIYLYGACIAAYAGYNALNGITYRYPFTISFIK